MDALRRARFQGLRSLEAVQHSLHTRTRAAADRYGSDANCLHPGFVATRFGDQTGGLISFSLRIGKRFALSPQQGAETLVYLASSSEVANVTGEYFNKCSPTTPNWDAQDDATAQALWVESIRLAHLG